VLVLVLIGGRLAAHSAKRMLLNKSDKNSRRFKFMVLSLFYGVICLRQFFTNALSQIFTARPEGTRT
jgi:hypothetical protein